MSENVRLIIAGLGGGALVLASVFGLNQAHVETPMLPKPTAEAPAITANCPDGWADKSDTPQDTIVYSCTKDGWIVILTPDKKFERGWKPGLREWTTNPREVDGWPD